jgi:hypothetical protein
MAKRDELVWFCKKVSVDRNKCVGSQTKYTIKYKPPKRTQKFPLGPLGVD